MSSQITAVIIDDEISNIKGLQKKVEKLFPSINIIGAYQKPELAISAIKELKPQLIFLDIQMPRINGFELLEALELIDFQVIFVTAYSEYALQAFKQNAIDYILKPIDNTELTLAVEKAIGAIESQDKLKLNSKLLKLISSTKTDNNKLIVPTVKGLSFIPQDEVLHIEGYEGYTKIHLEDDSTLMSSYNLGKFEKVVSSNFFKCHKSHIVNINKVRHFENEGYLVLENKQRVPISRANRKAFLEIFS
ncbi:LytR/AlgR family response regulator transcription factor [Winogradskyella ludwigii]|jgi:two-component system LytT family response regulator|uniref:LytR/AlgR family response regulator transcription factor n=1 Tax=Winogradskyella ludwigii TaxID=2686076 RepID=UPI0015CA24EB|nr:LytTR family DNA-binding domain-containing protein [Winogradskyella ludwigii]